MTAIYLYTPLLLAAVIEHYGIRFFGRNHRWRVTKDVARAVVAHSTPGWLVASLLLALIIGVDQFVSLSPYVPGIRLPIGIVLALGAIFLGLLAFETLVYIGMRRMRFANPPESACVQTDNRSTGRDQ